MKNRERKKFINNKCLQSKGKFIFFKFKIDKEEKKNIKNYGCA